MSCSATDGGEKADKVDRPEMFTYDIRSQLWERVPGHVPLDGIRSALLVYLQRS